METITKFFTAAKAKWDALGTGTKLLILGTIAGSLAYAVLVG